MAGVKQQAHVTLYINGKKEDDITGDILFTKYGISGFAILDLSHKASFALTQYSDVSIGIDLFNDMNPQQLSATIRSICNHLPEYTILEIVTTLIPSKMAPLLLQNTTIASQTKAKDLHTKQIKQLVNAFKNWRFSVTQTHGFAHAEVSGGGVCTAQVNAKTMESLKIKGLYFGGEVLDIVGRRGGYNLHFAFASGVLAAKSMINTFLNDTNIN
jgi:predicted Rossmann fold flavoprotein